METNRGRGSLTSRYLAALLAPAVVAGVILVTWPFFEHNLVSPYLLAVIFCAWYGGLGSGLLSLVISFLLIDHFFLEPYFFFWFPRPADLVRLMLFAVVGALISLMSELMYRERRRAEINLESAERAERSLREKERFANQIAELTPVVINVLDLSTRRGLYISPDVETLLGYTAKEILEMEDPFSLLWHPEDIPRASEKLAQMKHAKDGEIADVEYRIQRRDGEWRWVSSRTMPFERDEHGIVRQIISASVDITERKRVEEALRERSEVLQAIFDHIPVMLCFIDQTGRMKLANREFERVFGWTLAEIRGHPDMFAECYPDPDYRAGVLAFIRESTGKFAEFQTRTRSGAVIPTSFANVFLADGTSIGIGLDITERKRAEHDLIKQKEILEQIVDHIPVMINFTDNNGRIKLVNRGWQRTLGWSLEEALNEDIDVFAQCYPDPEYRQDILKFIAAATEEWKDFKTRVRDGRVIDTSWARVKLSDGTTLGIGQDITERKRAEESLTLFRNLIDRSSDAIEVIDPTTMRFLDCNESAYQTLGYSREEFLSLSVFDIDPSVDESLLAWSDGEMKRSGFVTFESLHRRKDGSTFPVELSVKIVRLEKDYRLAVVRDITERKLAQEALHQAEKKYRDIFENAVEGIFQTTRDGRFITANPALARMFGFDSPEELIRERADISLQHYVEPQRREEFKRLLEEHGVVRGFEYQAYRKGGCKIWILEDVRAVCDERGSVLYYEGTSEDITERKRAEEALRESEERYRELFENAKDATYVHDLSGRYTSVNRAAEKLTGRSREEIVGRRFTDFVPLEQIKVVSEQLCRKLVDEGETTYETEVIARDGSRIPVEVSSHLIYQNAVSVGVQGTARDITERKRAEELLRIKEQRFRSLIENSSDAIALFSANGNILYASPSTPTVIGFAPEQLLSFTVFELIHPEDQKAFAECFTTLLKKPGMRMNLQSRVLHKDGSWRWLEGTLTNLLEEPDVGAIVNNYRDITERRRAEDDLRQQKEILQKIFDHIPLMIRLAGPDGGVQLVNREYERTMGWSLEELQKKNLNIFELYPNTNEQQVILDRIVTAKGEWADFKTKVRDGRIIDTSWTTIHLSAGMNLGIGQDISERKRAEEMLRSYSRQLIEAQETERQHIARELHDQIGQVLTAVRINLQTIWNSCDVPASRSLIDEGIVVVDKALEQVRDLSFELRPSLLDDLGLTAALRWCADRFAHRTMIQTRSTISLQDRMRLKPELETACYRIVQEALTNIARHARARNVAINLRTLNREIVLSIKDDGIGFDAPFLNDGSSPIRLGLRGMRERALALGGRLEIESASSAGTEIRAYFPNGSKKNK